MSKVNNKFAQLRALQKDNDKSLQYLINEAYRILGNPIILYDFDWKILASAEGVITDDPIWNNHVNNRAMDSVDIFKNAGFTDIMIRTDKVTFLKSEELKYDRIFGKIYDNDGLPIAGVSVVASNKPFEDEDLMVTEAICKIFCNEIRKIPYYQNYAQNKLDTYINMLINGNIKDKLYASGYIDMIYTGLKENIYCAVADISQCDPTYSKLVYYRDLFKRMRPAFKYSIYSNYIVIIMSAGKGVFYPKKCFHRLNKVLEKDNIFIGISSRFENLFELSRYYDQAVNALNDGLKSSSHQQIFASEKNDG